MFVLEAKSIEEMKMLADGLNLALWRYGVDEPDNDKCAIINRLIDEVREQSKRHGYSLRWDGPNNTYHIDKVPLSYPLPQTNNP